MMVYRSQAYALDTREEQQHLAQPVEPSLDALQSRLIRFGIFESALADALDSDDHFGQRSAARQAAIALAAALVRCQKGLDPAPALQRYHQLLSRLSRFDLPATLEASVPEGYAFYSLSPAAYIDAASRYLRDRGTPHHAIVIGIRSIGTSLSAIIAAVLQAESVNVHSYTVRPAGHPWDRTLKPSPMMARDWTESAAASQFLIVDEGPGLSGTSFRSVAEALSKLGVPDHHIALFPSWNAPASALNNASARERWIRHRRYVGEAPPEPWIDGARDLSGGEWRRHEFNGTSSAWPPANPQHESRKYLRGATLYKFAGYGDCGHWKLPLQQQLAAAGFSASATGLHDGFIQLHWHADARPLTASPATDALLDRIAAYCAWRAKHLPAPRSLTLDHMLDMIQVNTREALSRDLDRTAVNRLARAFNHRPACRIDGRMLVHEWLETPAGFLKSDATDHHADHFYPGCADIAWDLAAVIAEFSLDAQGERYLLDRYFLHSRDEVPAELLVFYKIAWLAFRTGYATLAAQSLSDPAEHDRFSAVRLAYACQLQREIAPKLRTTAC